MLKGTTIQLFERTQTGEDAFRVPIYTYHAVNVDNILIAPVSDQEITDTLNLTGKKAVYQLAIPKGDMHEWENRIVQFFGRKWRVIGQPLEGMDDLIPLGWNKKVKVESVIGECES